MNTRRIAVASALSAAAVAGFVLFSGTAESEEHQRTPDQVRVVEVRNDCPDPVWISYGRAAPRRKVDAVTLGAGLSSFEPMLEGDMVWLLDDAREAVMSATVEDQTKSVVVDHSCLHIHSQRR